MTLEFHRMRAGAAAKRTGGSLKPDIDRTQPLAVNATLRVHSHADGTPKYDCSESHAETSSTPASEPQQ